MLALRKPKQKYFECCVSSRDQIGTGQFLSEMSGPISRPEWPGQETVLLVNTYTWGIDFGPVLPRFAESKLILHLHIWDFQSPEGVYVFSVQAW